MISTLATSNTSRTYKSVRGKRTIYYVDFADNRAFRIVHCARNTWQVEEWNRVSNQYDFAGDYRTDKDALNAVMIENA